MKYILCAVAIACYTATISAQVKTPIIQQQVVNANGNPMLLGHTYLSELRKAPFDSWFYKNYADYQPDSLLCLEIGRLLRKKKIDIFMGTWCGDSKREVPAMLKILERAGYDTSNIALVTVGNDAEWYKKSPQGEEQGKNIVRVPTFIVYDKRKEIGRIIEYPVESLEKDLLKILKEEAYTPNYSQLKL